VRRATGSESSTANVTSGFTAASVALTLEVSITVRRASAPKVHVPVASAGSAAFGVKSNAPAASGPTSVPVGELPSGLPFNSVS